MADLSQADWRTLKQLRAASKLSFNIFPSLHMCIHSLILTTILLKQQDFNLVFIWYVQGFFYTSCEKFYLNGHKDFFTVSYRMILFYDNSI